MCVEPQPALMLMPSGSHARHRRRRRGARRAAAPPVRRAVRAVEQHAPAARSKARSALELAQVVVDRAVRARARDRFGAGAGAASRRPPHCLDAASSSSDSFRPVGAEELDAVVVVRVVRGRDRRAQVEPVAPDEDRGRRVGSTPASRACPPAAAIPAQSAASSISPGHAGVAHDQDLRRRRVQTAAAARPSENASSARQELARDAANAIGPEELAAIGANAHLCRRAQRFENCGRLRAFLRPALLRSFSRGSRVRNRGA